MLQNDMQNEGSCSHSLLWSKVWKLSYAFVKEEESVQTYKSTFEVRVT